MKKFIICVSLLLIFIVLSAQNVNNDYNPLFQFPSTLNLNKLKTSQSISFTSIMSSKSKPVYISNFQNRFSYDLTKNLQLQMDLNIVNYNNSNTNNGFSLKENTQVLPNFKLDYNPNENFHLRIEYNTYPRLLPYYGY